MDELDASAVRGKVSLLPGYEPDLSSVTFCLEGEDHTLGNALRYMLMKDPRVEFCGYTNPHPSENKIHMRVQMVERISALDAFRDALDRLDEVMEAVGDKYAASLERGEYERAEVPRPKVQHAESA